MKITHTHHMALLTSDFERSRAFYVDTLDLPVSGGFPGRKIIFINVGSTTIELVENTGPATAPNASGWIHLALEVSDVDATVEELSARGVVFHVQPKDFPEEAPSVRIAFFKDPDGNVLELVQPLEGRYPTP